MREPAFLKRNKEKWQAIEKKLQQVEGIGPDERAEIFVELTDDLSYARTFYPTSNTTKYLNGLAVKMHQAIYKTKKERSSRVWDFWKVELPTLFYNYQKELLWAAILFFASIFVGALSTVYDDTFIRLILGDAYVNMTLENIESGDPLAVYKSSSSGNMFLRITLNNIMVSFWAFVLGIFLSVGTAVVIFRNGVMVGSFFTFFFKKGLATTSLLGVFIHGAFELSAIVIAGCAGFVIGNSILFPGTYSRLHSFKRGAKDALKIIIGLIPVFVIAGFLESFVTRHYQSSWLLNLTIIVVSFAIMIYYFILYPIQLNQVNTNYAEREN